MTTGGEETAGERLGEGVATCLCWIARREACRAGVVTSDVLKTCETQYICTSSALYLCGHAKHVGHAVRVKHARYCCVACVMHLHGCSHPATNGKSTCDLVHLQCTSSRCHHRARAPVACAAPQVSPQCACSVLCAVWVLTFAHALHLSATSRALNEMLFQ